MVKNVNTAPLHAYARSKKATVKPAEKPLNITSAHVKGKKTKSDDEITVIITCRIAYNSIGIAEYIVISFSRGMSRAIHSAYKRRKPDEE